MWWMARCRAGGGGVTDRREEAVVADLLGNAFCSQSCLDVRVDPGDEQRRHSITPTG
jgi:hypothetical protein